jgi:urocanate hydratase
VLTNDPATGVLRHVDPGYDEAAGAASRDSVQVPMHEQT